MRSTTGALAGGRPGDAGQSAFITGCSSGFGLGLAVELARRGWQVLPSMRDPGKRAALEAAWSEAGLDASPHVIALDVRSPESVRAAAAAVTSRLGGPPDALVLNAGYTTVGFFEDVPADQVRDVVETNLLGAMEVTRAFLPGMRGRGRGRIMVMSSNAANVPHPMFAPYAATKWGLEGWAEALAMELAPFGIHVMVAQPGAHGTQFSHNLRSALPSGSAYAGIFAAASSSLDWLGRHQRDPARAVRALADILESPRPPFRARIGPDAVACAMAARLLPYRMRSELLARFLRFPSSRRGPLAARPRQLRHSSAAQPPASG
jgi:NAD(P)-dependent dehydrogenase (short-subunit alcohol dehydrogenase family)